MQTLRRLNDPERYYGLSWRGWLGVGLAGGLVYALVRISPLGLRPTVTFAVLLLAFFGVVLHALSGHALGAGRHLLALVRYALAPRRLVMPRAPEQGGLVLDTAPSAQHNETDASDEAASQTPSSEPAGEAVAP